MGKISVLYLSCIDVLPGTGYRSHTHDYWHFSMRVSGSYESDKKQESVRRPKAFCHGPGVLSSQNVAVSRAKNILVLFMVHDKNLYNTLMDFPFADIPAEDLHVSFLQDLLSQVHEFHPSQDYVDYAFGHYLFLLLETYKHNAATSSSQVLVNQALKFIEENYMNQIKLEDVAKSINRTPQHTASLIKKSTDMTVVDHIRKFRLKHACNQLAYSNKPIEKIISECGFANASYFHRVFKEALGTTPNRYRTSHDVRDVFYCGEEAPLDIPYEEPVFTYIPAARKCIDWKTPREYLAQEIK